MSEAIPIYYSGYEPSDCPVCGAKNGTCQGESTWDGHPIEFKKKEDDPKATFSIPRRVYENRMVGKRETKRLLYVPGDRVTPEEAQRLGFLRKNS